MQHRRFYRLNEQERRWALRVASTASATAAATASGTAVSERAMRRGRQCTSACPANISMRRALSGLVLASLPGPVEGAAEISRRPQNCCAPSVVIVAEFLFLCSGAAAAYYLIYAGLLECQKILAVFFFYGSPLCPRPLALFLPVSAGVLGAVHAVAALMNHGAGPCAEPPKPGKGSLQ